MQDNLDEMAKNAGGHAPIGADASKAPHSDFQQQENKPVQGRQKEVASNIALPLDCSVEIEVGCFYEINHKKLPSKSPSQIKRMRIVAVDEWTTLNTTVKFPSVHSLKSFFGETPSSLPGSAEYPLLDEKIVMGNALASLVLHRRISSTDLARNRHLKRFWVISPSSPQPKAKEVPKETSSLAVVSSLLPEWGRRRKVRILGRHRQSPVALSIVRPAASSAPEGSVEQTLGAKRPYDSTSNEGKKKKLSTEMTRIGSKERWSKERYEAAELKLLQIMREKGAVLGNPILRPALRMEARKHIGDTGLLDHLLKHMAGMVDREKDERLRRRHNPEGHMEYWLERADLLDLRQQAGVNDPYWIPPAGWKPGDHPYHDPETLHQLRQIKEDVKQMQSKVDQLSRLCHTEHVDNQHGFKRCIHEETISSLESKCMRLQESYNTLQGQCHAVFETLKSMQAEMRRLSSRNKVEGEAGMVDKEGGRERERKKARSGFRICKPQGTFIWPSMASSPNTPQMMQVEDLLAVPTPPSTSSATSPPPHNLPRAGPASPVKPVPQNRASTTNVPSRHELGAASSTWHINGGRASSGSFPSSAICEPTARRSPPMSGSLEQEIATAAYSSSEVACSLQMWSGGTGIDDHQDIPAAGYTALESIPGSGGDRRLAKRDLSWSAWLALGI